MRRSKLFTVITFASAVALFGLAGTARPQTEDSSCVCRALTPGGLRMFLEDDEGDFSHVMWLDRRARLGIWLEGEAEPATDSIGARVERVAPGGPAAAAGIRAGDIITKLNGESLTSGDELYDEDESAPALRLIERARALERGDTVEVEFRRDGETRTVELVAGDFGIPLDLDLDRKLGRLQGTLDRLRDLPRVEYRGPESFALRLGTAFPDLQLVSVNPKLGEYFGTDRGVLVVSVPEDSELNLAVGDVILAIDGREVSTPSHAMRILRSYEPEEEISFRLMRKKKERTVKGGVPERSHDGIRLWRHEDDH